MSFKPMTVGVVPAVDLYAEELDRIAELLYTEALDRIAELEAELAERTRERDEAIRRADCAMVLVAEMESGNSTLRNAGVIALERAEKAEADRDAAIKRAEAAGMDAARYRWLRDDALQLLVSGPICVAADKWGKPLTQHPGNNSENGPALHITLDGKELDAAIDATMKD